MITLWTLHFIFLINIFYQNGESISLYLLRSKGFAVKYPRPGLTRFILCASYLLQPQLVNNTG